MTALGLLAAAALPAEEAAGDRNQPQTTLREELTVVADRLEVPRRSSGSSVTVLEAADLVRSEKLTVAEVLRTLPGVEVSRTAGPGSVTSVFLRGGSSAFTLVLIDGVRVNSPATGSFDFADLPADAIERIEIVRGPQSTLYGSEAIGGVIAITTRRGTAGGVEGSLLAEAGSDGLGRLRGEVYGGGAGFDYGLSLSGASSDGISAAAVAGGDADAYDNATFTGRAGFDVGGGRLDLNLRLTDAELEVDGFGFTPGGGFGPVDDPNASQSRRALVAGVRLTVPWSRRITQSFRLGRSSEELDGEDPDTVFNNFAIDAYLTGVETQADVVLSERATLVLGAAYEDRGARVAGGFDDGADLASLFGQLRLAWGERAALTVGLRRDDHQTFGGETTFRLTGSYAWSSGTRLHASAGSGFRAPSLNELYFPFFGNRDLAPETSVGVEVGVEQRFAGDRLRVDVTAFDNDFDDLIGVGPDFRARNVDRATARGVELALSYRPAAGLVLAASHTRLAAEDEATGLRLPRRPRDRSTLRLDFDHRRLSASAAVIAVAGRADVGGVDLDDYVRTDLTLRYRLSAPISLHLRAENLLDREYQEVLGFTTPGRQLAAGLRYAF